MAAPRTQQHEIAVVGARAAGRGHRPARGPAGPRRGRARPGAAARATPCPPTPSPAAVWSSSTAGACSTRWWPAALPPIRQITFHTPEGSIDRTVKDSAGVDFLVAPRRHVLDTIVAQAAAEAGATLRLGVTVTGLRQRRHGRVTGLSGHDLGGEPVEIDAAVVVGADGLRSRVARDVGAGRGGGPGAAAAPPGTPTTGGPSGGPSSSSSARAPWPACSPPTGARPASGCASPPPPPVPPGRPPDPSPRASTGCWSSSPPRWPSGCVPASAPRRSGAPAASPTRCARPGARAGRWWATPSTTGTRSPATASPTPTGTPSCWPARWTRACATPAARAGPSTATGAEADAARREIFDLTCRAGRVPPARPLRPPAAPAQLGHRHRGDGPGRQSRARSRPPGRGLNPVQPQPQPNQGA